VRLSPPFRLFQRYVALIICNREMVILRKKLVGITQTALDRFAAKATRAAGVRGEVNVLVTSSEEVRELNRRFRNKNKPTDVLSFPSTTKGFGGDIAISSDIARQNGESLGHGLAMELKILILHGVLHLAGFDHETDDGEMALKEMRLREHLGLKESLIERSEHKETSPKRLGAKTKISRLKLAPENGRRK
jgi:probable rRNA maturation factor